MGVVSGLGADPKLNGRYVCYWRTSARAGDLDLPVSSCFRLQECSQSRSAPQEQNGKVAIASKAGLHSFICLPQQGADSECISAQCVGASLAVEQDTVSDCCKGTAWACLVLPSGQLLAVGTDPRETACAASTASVRHH